MSIEESLHAGFNFEKPKPERLNRAKNLYVHVELMFRDVREKAAKDEEPVLIAIIGHQSFVIHSLGYAEPDSDFMYLWGKNSNGEEFEIISSVEQTSFMALKAKKAEEEPRRQIGFLGALTTTPEQQDG
jgi:hypothetical protein